MTAEANARHPCETGGVLLGLLGLGGRTAAVSLAVGPGTGARHRRDSFVPDHDYHDAEVAAAYEKSAGSVVYLGDWHSHPSADAYLSRTDRETLALIATTASARLPRPFMLVLGRSGRDWSVAAWQAEVPGGRTGSSPLVLPARIRLT